MVLLKGGAMPRSPHMSAVLMLCAAVVLTSIPVLAEAQDDEHLRGFEDGQREGRRHTAGVNFLWGFLDGDT